LIGVISIGRAAEPALPQLVTASGSKSLFFQRLRATLPRGPRRDLNLSGPIHAHPTGEGVGIGP
jgi:hypothetical protein